MNNGRCTAQSSPGQADHWRLILHACCFVGCFTLVFIALGACASVRGQFLRTHLGAVRYIAGLIIVLFGLHTAGVLRLRVLYRERRMHPQTVGDGGVGRSAILGLAFGAGCSPCVGPTLGSILLPSSTSGGLAHGVVMLPAYALGLGLPFVIVAVAASVMRGFVRCMNRYCGLIERLGGALLVLMGVLVYEGTTAS